MTWLLPPPFPWWIGVKSVSPTSSRWPSRGAVQVSYACWTTCFTSASVGVPSAICEVFRATTFQPVFSFQSRKGAIAS